MYQEDWLDRVNAPYLELAKRKQAGYLPDFVGQFEEVPERGFWDAAVAGAKAQAAGTVASQAEAFNIMGIGDGATANALNQVAQENARRREYTWQDMVNEPMKYITDPEGLTYDLAGGLASTAVFMGETAALGGVGGVAARATGLANKIGGTARLVQGIKTVAEANNMPWLSKIMESPSGKMLVLNVMKTPLESLSIAGSAGKAVGEQGGNIEQQRSAALQAGALNTVVGAFTNTLESVGLGKLIAKEGGKDLFTKKVTSVVSAAADGASKPNFVQKIRQYELNKGALANYGKSAVALTGNALLNAYEEGAQETIEQYTTGKKGSVVDIINPFAWDDEALTSAAIGGVTGAGQGAVMTGVGKGLNTLFGVDEQSDKKAKEFKPTTAAAKKSTTSEEESEVVKDSLTTQPQPLTAEQQELAQAQSESYDEAFGVDEESIRDFEEKQSQKLSETVGSGVDEETAEAEYQRRNELMQLALGMDIPQFVGTKTKEQAKQSPQSPVKANNWNRVHKGTNISIPQKELPAPTFERTPQNYVGSYTTQGIEKAINQSDNKLKELAHKIQHFDDSDRLKINVFRELRRRGIALGENFSIDADESQIIPYGSTELSTEQPQDFQKAEAPATVTQVPRERVQQAIDKYIGQPQMFKQHINDLISFVGKAVAENRISKDEAKVAVAQIKAFHDEVVTAIGGTIRQYSKNTPPKSKAQNAKTSYLALPEATQKAIEESPEQAEEIFEQEAQEYVNANINNIVDINERKKVARLDRDNAHEHLRSLLKPALDILNKGRNNGYSFAEGNQDNGRMVRVSNNDVWYQEFRKERKHKPLVPEMEELAYQLLIDKFPYTKPAEWSFEITPDEYEAYENELRELKQQLDYARAYYFALDEAYNNALEESKQQAKEKGDKNGKSQNQQTSKETSKSKNNGNTAPQPSEEKKTDGEVEESSNKELEKRIDEIASKLQKMEQEARNMYVKMRFKGEISPNEYFKWQKETAPIYQNLKTEFDKLVEQAPSPQIRVVDDIESVIYEEQISGIKKEIKIFDQTYNKTKETFDAQKYKKELTQHLLDKFYNPLDIGNVSETDIKNLVEKHIAQSEYNKKTQDLRTKTANYIAQKYYDLADDVLSVLTGDMQNTYELLSEIGVSNQDIKKVFPIFEKLYLNRIATRYMHDDATNHYVSLYWKIVGNINREIQQNGIGFITDSSKINAIIDEASKEVEKIANSNKEKKLITTKATELKNQLNPNVNEQTLANELAKKHPVLLSKQAESAPQQEKKAESKETLAKEEKVAENGDFPAKIGNYELVPIKKGSPSNMRDYQNPSNPNSDFYNVLVDNQTGVVYVTGSGMTEDEELGFPSMQDAVNFIRDGEAYKGLSAKEVKSKQAMVKRMENGEVAKPTEKETPKVPKATQAVIDYVKEQTNLDLTPYLDNTFKAKRGQMNIRITSMSKVQLDALKMFVYKTSQGYGSYQIEIEDLGNWGITLKFKKKDGSNPVKYSATELDKKFQAAYHGSPHIFNEFSLEHIGTGEGAQVHGWGLYFTASERVAKGYRERLSHIDPDEAPKNVIIDGIKYRNIDGTWENTTTGEDYDIDSYHDVAFNAIANQDGDIQAALNTLKSDTYYSQDVLDKAIKLLEQADSVDYQVEISEGSVFEVDIPENDVLLDEEKTFAEQSPKVQEALQSIVDKIKANPDQVASMYYIDDLLTNSKLRGRDIYYRLSRTLGGNDRLTSLVLNDHGIKGITYVSGQDGRCYVIFDDKAIAIKRRYDTAMVEHQNEIKEAADKQKALLKDALKGGKFEIQDNGDYKVTMPNGVVIYASVKDQIIINEAEMQNAKTAHKLSSNDISILGSWQKITSESVNGFLNISASTAKDTTAYHEVTHALIDLVLTPKQKELLFNTLKPLAEQANKDLEEFVCDYVADWRLKRKNANLFGKLWNKLVDVAKQLQAWFTSTENMHNLLRKIESGEVWQQDAIYRGDNDAKYSAEESSPKTATAKVSYAMRNSRPKDFWAQVKEKGFFKSLWDKFYTDWVDKLKPLEMFDQINSISLGRELKQEEKVRERAQSVSYNAAGITHALLDGNSKDLEAVNAMLKNKKLPHEATLQMVLDKIKPSAMNEKYGKQWLQENGFEHWFEALSNYLLARRLREMWNRRKADYDEQIQIRDEAISTLDETLQEKIKKWDEEVLEWERNGKEGKKPKKPKDLQILTDKLEDVTQLPLWSDMEYSLPQNLSIDVINQMIAESPKEFSEAAEVYYKLNDNLLTILEDAGIISKETHNILNEKYKEYCPLMRDFTDTAGADDFIDGLTSGGKGLANVAIPLHKIKAEGSERAVTSPLESTINAISVFTQRAERNKVAQLALEMVNKSGAKQLLMEMPYGTKPSVRESTFTILTDGKKKVYQCEPSMYGAIAGYNIPTASMVFKVASTAANMLRVGATSSPSFILRNLIRDTIFAGISSKNGFIPIYDTIRGWKALKNNPQLAAEFHAAGVDQFSFYGNGESRYNKLAEMAKEDNHSIFNPKTWIKFSELAEASTRMGEYIRAKEKGKDIRTAAEDARNVTLNFTRSGVRGEQVNKVIPFFNAVIQGGDKMMRMFREDFVGTCTRTFTYIILPSLALWALNHDEDWYKKLNPEIKNQYWCLGKNLKVPKPQELGVLFGSGSEAILDTASGIDKKAIGNWSKAFLGNLLPNVIPTVLLPIVEWQANYNFFRGKEVVSKKLQRLPDELQFTDATSGISKAIGGMAKISPAKIDNLVMSATGTMGMLFYQGLGLPLDEAKNVPAKHWFELPFFRDFAVTNYNLNRNVNEFYEIYNASEKQHTGYGKKGSPSIATKNIRNAYKAISDINKDIQKIQNSSRLSAERKRVLMDKKRNQIEKIAEKIVRKYGEYYM